MHDLSVIIPTYNRVTRLARALESVLNQRELPAEIIVVDDGSTDRTEDLVGGFARNSPVAIHYLYQQNRGPAAARNRGLADASGAYVAFLDSDDQWHEDKIKYQLPALQAEPSYLISHTQERWLRNGRHLNQKKIHEPLHGDVFARSLKLCCVGMSTVMAHKTLFERYGLFNESLRCCEDYDLWLRVSPFEPFLLVDRRLTIKHGGCNDQVSVKFREGMDRFRIQGLAVMLENTGLDEEQRAAVRAELLRRCAIYGSGCAKHGKKREARFYREMEHYVTTDEKSFINHTG